MGQVSSIIQSTKHALRDEAYKQFGAAVENQVGGFLQGVFGGPGGPRIESEAELAARQSEPRVWHSSTAASDIASGAGNYDPRQKFLFDVKFKFNPTVAETAQSLGVNTSELTRDLSYIVKQIDLPKIQLEYEDVNMYNFKTKVLRSSKYSDISVQFYDDVANHGISFLNVYAKILIPLMRAQRSPSVPLWDHGFAFNDNQHALNASMRSLLKDNAINIVDEIIITQHYVRRAQMTADIASTKKMNVFTLTNPKFTQIDFSDQDYDSSGANIISIQFEFDALHLVADPVPSADLAGADKTTNFTPSQLRRGGPSVASSSNPFLDIIANQGKRAINTAVGNKLRKIVGNSKAGGALAGAIGQVGGTLGSAFGRAVGGLSGNKSLSLSVPPFISDNSVSQSVSNFFSSRSKPDLSGFDG